MKRRTWNGRNFLERIGTTQHESVYAPNKVLPTSRRQSFCRQDAGSTLVPGDLNSRGDR